MTFFQHQAQIINISIGALIGLFLWLIYLTFSYGLADIFAEKANYEMQLWENQEVALDTWNSTQTTLQRALQFEPQNPDLLEMMGKIYDWKAKRSFSLPEQIFAHQRALDYFLKAAKKRPISALTWANILLLKNALFQYDAQFSMALEQTILQAPWHPFVHRVVVYVGLSAWQHLSENGQFLVLIATERGLGGKEAKQIENIIQQSQHKQTICKYSQQSQELLNFCLN